MSQDNLQDFIDSVDWEATEEKHQDRFWSWAIDDGKCEDYILDNFADLFTDWALGELEESEYVYEA